MNYPAPDDPGRAAAVRRILAAVTFTPPPPDLAPDWGPCWLLPGGDNRGRVRIRYGAGPGGKRRRTYAYRLTYLELRGTIPAALQPDHVCRRPACANPWHVELVTAETNGRRGAVMRRGVDDDPLWQLPAPTRHTTHALVLAS